jgi:hypothetical protein
LIWSAIAAGVLLLLSAKTGMIFVLCLSEREAEGEWKWILCGNGMIRVNKIFGTERGWGRRREWGMFDLR